MKTVDELLSTCSNILPGHGRRRTMKMHFTELADQTPGDSFPDVYGKGEYLSAFEQEVAALFGKEAAVFMPSGTMAQQISLRIWCDRRGRDRIAMHPASHPEFAEHAGYLFLHNLKRLQFGAPEFLHDRILKVSDFSSLGQLPGAALIELPFRPLGGQLPEWDDLAATRDWAQANGVALHLDGARIWSCRPFYEKSFVEIADLFDSVYVSFYKDLGGLAGAMLLGPEDFIREARVWQKRHGGLLRTQAPMVVSAKIGLDRTLPVIDEWVEKAQEAASILSKFPEVAILPDPPHVNFFRIFVRGDRERLNARNLQVAEETGAFVFFGFGDSAVPGMAAAEMHFWENAMEFDMSQLAPFMAALLED